MTPRERWRSLYRTVRLIDRDWAPTNRERVRSDPQVGALVRRTVRLFRDDPLPSIAPCATKRVDLIESYQNALGSAVKSRGEREGHRRDYMMWEAYAVVSRVRDQLTNRWPGQDDLSACVAVVGNAGWRVWLLADRENRAGTVGPGTVLVRSFHRKVLSGDYGEKLSADEWVAAARSAMDAATA